MGSLRNFIVLNRNFRKITTQNKEPLPAEAVAAIFKSIMKKCRGLKLIIIRNETMKSIGIQEAKGSFFEIAAQQFEKIYKITDFHLII